MERKEENGTLAALAEPVTTVFTISTGERHKSDIVSKQQQVKV
jgi:hypothetical protein